MKKSSLCWKCKKSVGGCSWSREFKPVNGWKAERTIISNHSNRGNKYQRTKIESYIVSECPEFDGGKLEKAKVNDALIEAIVKLIIKDYRYWLVYTTKRPEDKEARMKFDDINIGILADIFKPDVIKTIFHKLNNIIKKEMEIMDDYAAGTDEKELFEKYGKSEVEKTVKRYSRHPVYIGRRSRNIEKSRQ